MPKQNATMRIERTSANFVVAVPASAFAGVDDDENGLISQSEIYAHKDDIETQFLAGFEIRGGRGPVAGGKPFFTLPHSDGATSGSDYIIVIYRVDLGDALLSPTIAFDLFGNGADETRLTLRASRGETVERAILDLGNPSHTFFAAD